MNVKVMVGGHAGPLASVAIALALALSLLLAPAAAAADSWSGIWNTKHRFGKPKLDIELIKKDGDDRIKGVYFNDEGELTGRIWGDRTREGRTQVWSGRFKDFGSNNPGKFRVELQSDEVSFEGWFKTCGRIFCSDRYRWTGEHA